MAGSDSPPHDLDDLTLRFQALLSRATFNADRRLQASVLGFDIGTAQRDIWEWFRAQHPDFDPEDVAAGARAFDRPLDDLIARLIDIMSLDNDSGASVWSEAITRAAVRASSIHPENARARAAWLHHSQGHLRCLEALLDALLLEDLIQGPMLEIPEDGPRIRYRRPAPANAGQATGQKHLDPAPFDRERQSRLRLERPRFTGTASLASCRKHLIGLVRARPGDHTARSVREALEAIGWLCPDMESNAMLRLLASGETWRRYSVATRILDAWAEAQGAALARLDYVEDRVKIDLYRVPMLPRWDAILKDLTRTS